MATKKDYELVAGIMREARGLFETNDAVACMSVIVAKFASKFHDDNRAFDIERFIHACLEVKHG